MKETQAIRFKNQWHQLHEKRTKVDHEIAQLAHEIRKQFADGQSGEAEAVDWFRSELGLMVLAARQAVSDGEAWNCVRNVEHWVSIGGLRSARIIASLAPKQRMVVLSESLARADKRKRPITSTIVRDIAWKHGFVEKEPPKVTEAKKAAALTAFVNRLYATVQGLPPMPAEIKAIVKPATKRIARAA
ncbi:MAG: hypothetical protein AB7E70_19730 [Hyphomicrobiaceae bacterium]